MNLNSCLLVGTLLLSANGAGGQLFGLSNRIPVSTLKLPLSAPMTGYAATNAFGSLSFTDPLAIVTPPGETNRLFVVEQRGRVAVITNLAAPTRTVFLDISGNVTGGLPTDEQGLLGMAFHPGYATNGYFYVYYTLTTTTAAGTGRHERLARFEVSSGNPNFASAATEAPILTMFDEAPNHNGGDIHFGADDYLYLSLGDEGNGNDSLNNSQMIDKDFWSSMLRIDVDNLLGNLPPNPHPAIHPGTYSVPADNPFVGVTTWYGSNLVPVRVRTEFYAIGLRNPWRWSFDPPSGLIYCGDVGQNAREEIDIIEKGGNYGWAFREGLIAGPKPAPSGAMRIDPILDYPRTGNSTNIGTSVTGGIVYRANRIPALYGKYIFGDYVSGNIWALTYNGTKASNWMRLTVNTGVAGFGIDPSNGDVLLADQNADTIKRLVQITTSPPPATLADTGAFTNLATLTPHSGFVPYDVNVPFWSDNAIQTRWFYIPTNRQMTFRATNNWSFSAATGAVWIQHFELELTNGVPESRKRLETRFLVRDAGTGIYGLAYRWDSPTNAVLVPEAGLDEPLTVNDGGVVRTQVWHYPGRSECPLCHTTTIFGGQVLGFNTPQLNRDFNYGEIVDNQIHALANAGYFSATVANLHSLRALAHPTNEAVSVEQRVRSWLTANCVGCHQPNAPGGGSFDTRIFTTLPQTRLVNGLLSNNGGDTNNRVVVPGDLAHSMLLTRIASRDANDKPMPPLDSTLVDTQVVALMARWITNDLPDYLTFPQWQILHFNSTNAANALATADPDNDGANNLEEYLEGTDPNDGQNFWPIGIERDGDRVGIKYSALINRGVEIQWNTNLPSTSAWQFLNLPENRPFIFGTNGVVVVPDTVSNGATKFYRARVFEP